MPRIARVAIPGVPYHVTQRGNGRQQIFFDERDYRLYLDLLRRYSEERGLRIWAYCLMPNHVHLIVVPGSERATAQALGRTHADYARHYNLQQRACGHVWQARYFSTPLDSRHLWQAMAYVERNPVRACLAKQAEEYAWSSAQVRQGSVAHGSMVELAQWETRYDWPRWREVLFTSVEEEAFGLRLQEASRRGRPLGDEGFTEELESRCGRRLRTLPVGKPKKAKADHRDQLTSSFGI